MNRFLFLWTPESFGSKPARKPDLTPRQLKKKQARDDCIYIFRPCPYWKAREEEFVDTQDVNKKSVGKRRSSNTGAPTDTTIAPVDIASQRKVSSKDVNAASTPVESRQASRREASSSHASADGAITPIGMARKQKVSHKHVNTGDTPVESGPSSRQETSNGNSSTIDSSVESEPSISPPKPARRRHKRQNYPEPIVVYHDAESQYFAHKTSSMPQGVRSQPDREWIKQLPRYEKEDVE